MLNLVVAEGGGRLNLENQLLEHGAAPPDEDLEIEHREAGLPLIALQAMEQVKRLGELAQRIDETIEVIDSRLDALQPPATGKLRLIFRKRRQYLTPQFVKFILRKDGRWWAKPIKAGTATRSVKVSKHFERNADIVRLFCREGEELLRLRRVVNRLLGNVTAAGKGAFPPLDAKVQALRKALDME